MLNELLEHGVLIDELVRNVGKEVKSVLQRDGFAVGQTIFAHVHGTLIVERIAMGGKSPHAFEVDDNASPVGTDVKVDRDSSAEKLRVESERTSMGEQESANTPFLVHHAEHIQGGSMRVHGGRVVEILSALSAISSGK